MRYGRLRGHSGRVPQPTSPLLIGQSRRPGTDSCTDHPRAGGKSPDSVYLTALGGEYSVVETAPKNQPRSPFVVIRRILGNELDSAPSNTTRPVRLICVTTLVEVLIHLLDITMDRAMSLGPQTDALFQLRALVLLAAGDQTLCRNRVLQIVSPSRTYIICPEYRNCILLLNGTVVRFVPVIRGLSDPLIKCHIIVNLSGL